MNSIPRTASFHHQSISSTVAKAVTDLPGTLDDLVADYADESPYAELRLELNTDLSVINNETNASIRAAIRHILTGPGELRRKRIIFENLAVRQEGVSVDEHLRKSNERHRESIEELFNQIRSDGQQINLDYVDFTGIEIWCMTLTGASAVGAKFISTTMQYITWKGADFRGALFKNVMLTSCDLSDMVLHKSEWEKSSLEKCSITRARMEKITMVDVRFNLVIANKIKCDDSRLTELIRNISKSTLLTDTSIDQVDSLEQIFVDGYCDTEKTDQAAVLNCTHTSHRLL